MRSPRAARQSPSVARASADRRSSVFHAFAAGCAAIPIRGASVSRPSLERFPCVRRGLRGNPHPWRERQPTVARAFAMRLPRAARQSQSVARASADRRSSVFHAFAAGCAAIPIRGASVSRPSLERFPCVCRGPRGIPNPPHPWRERQPTVARAFAMRLPRAARHPQPPPSVARASADRRSSVFHAFAAGRAASLTPPIRGASVSRPSLERLPCICRGPRGNPHPWRERQPTVARAFAMRLPRAARQSPSVARASADRCSSVCHVRLPRAARAVKKHRWQRAGDPIIGLLSRC